MLTLALADVSGHSSQEDDARLSGVEQDGWSTGVQVKGVRKCLDAIGV